MVCPYCGKMEEVVPEYQAHLDHNGKRVDTMERAELCRGSYEFVATKDYCVEGKLPNPPAYIFCIDVTNNAVKSGMVNVACRKIKSLLDKLPREKNQEVSNMKVGIICYSRVLHFFNLDAELNVPKHMIVSDVGK